MLPVDLMDALLFIQKKNGIRFVRNSLGTLAHLEKECVIIGAGNHGEIWSQEKWNQYYNDNQDSYDDILESLDDFSL